MSQVDRVGKPFPLLARRASVSFYDIVPLDARVHKYFHPTRRLRMKIKISPLHLIAFLFVYFGNLLLFLALRGYLFIVIGMILTALVPLSFLALRKLADFVSGTIFIASDANFAQSEETIVRQKDDIHVIFKIDNPSLLCTLRAAWIFTVGNTFYGTSDQQTLLLSIPPSKKKQFQMKVTVTELGQIVFSCQELIFTDLLGIFKVHAPCSAECSLFVLPKQLTIERSELLNARFGAAELSECQLKGNDYSEVTDIRTYQPGDRPRDIHWKLSARQQELIVKERTTLAGSEQIVLIALPPKKADAEKLLTEGYRKIRGLIAEQTSLRLLIWENCYFSFASYPCDSEAALDAAFCTIFRTDLQSHSSQMLQQYMRNCYPQLESYLCLTKKEEMIQLEVCINV